MMARPTIHPTFSMPSFVAPCWAPTASAGMPLYIFRSENTWLNASMCVSLCDAMMSTSSFAPRWSGAP